MIEIWKPVLGYEGLYEVSNLGAVRSLPRRGRKVEGILVLAQTVSRAGYFVVSLSRNGVVSQETVHSLVLEAFVSPRPDGLVARHGPLGALVNSVSNLSWGTHQENMQDKIRDGVHHEANKTRCIRGHLLQAPNLLNHNGPANHRKCRACVYARQLVARTGENLLHAADRYYMRSMLERS